MLSRIRSESKNTKELGTKFEVITRDFFKIDSMYTSRFKKVWLWNQYPKRDGADTGIDLMAEQYNGEECAIQCKCYAEDGSIDTKSVAKFLAKASSLQIPNTILVYTGDHITNNAEKILRDSRTQILRQENFRDSPIDWSDFPRLARIKNPKRLRDHQIKAVSDVLTGLEMHDRGKLIMACGTGKTLTSLHIAEKQVGIGRIVLYVVPSISLILQSMREWSDNANIKHNYMAVCSDKSTGEDASITELESPVSTNPDTLKPYLNNRPKNAMTVIFCTYHSLNVIQSTRQKFYMIFCDEAHRTTGVEDKSFFTTIHKDSNIYGKKRLYMTATPRVYSDAIQARMGKTIYSMDDKKKYGPDFHNLSFGNAVKQNILADFKVKIAIVPADTVDKEFQLAVADADKTMPLDERTLLAGVWHGLQFPEDRKNPKLLQRVIAFANKIDRSMMFAGKINDEKEVNRSLENIVTQWNKHYRSGKNVKVEHIDGKTRAIDRRDKMRWLAESDDDPNTCRIVSNAKCLSEGVDVPALDGVIFLNPRKSRVDVVQSVGRVMRKSKGKDYGYVILPVAIPAGLEYHEALDDNKTFKVVWQVLNALRSHDENFAAEINRLILDKNTENTSPTSRISVDILDRDFTETEIVTRFFEKIKSKLVQKVGDIDYYDKYGQKLGSSANTIEERLKNKMSSDTAARTNVESFHKELQRLINGYVTLDDTVKAIAQHKVLSFVFDQLFSGEFSSHNPIAVAFDGIVKKIGLDEELDELQKFYDDVKKEVSKIGTDEARQSFIKKIYGNFFESADKKGTEQHGIVYTPVEVIDFIINSVQYILKTEFGTEFNDRQVKVLEPFAGTGTFLVRLLQSGYITTNLYEKYKNDLYANELILLAYYVATVNIETTYSNLRARGRYVPFDGISYTDTLEMNSRYRKDERYRRIDAPLFGDMKKAHELIRKQRWQHLHVLLGNPPYSAGQNNFNDQNQNVMYPEIDKRIKSTYIAKVKEINQGSINVVSLYDSYIRSIRWASDRIGDSGIIAFITNASFIRSDTAAGIRASLAEEFNEVWCFDLRGNQRTQGEISKQEGGKIFGSGSRAPVSITILVKNQKKKGCIIHYKDIGNYLSRNEKLKTINNYTSIKGIKDWEIIQPDKHYDWLDQRDDSFVQYAPIGSKDTKSGKADNAIFRMYSRGIATSRDAWVYNSSKEILAKNMKGHIDYCNSQNLDNLKIDPKQAKWDGGLSDKIKRGGRPDFNASKIRHALYRPFFKQHLYFDNIYNTAQHQIPKMFPKEHSENLVICIPDKGKSGMFSTLVTNITPDLHIIEASQCFPLYIYENSDKKDNITNSTLKEYQEHYNSKKITKQDIFYYVYSLLHHTKYKKKFANNLSRELPHIPMAPDFEEFVKLGRELAKLHLSYETCKKYNIKPKISKFGKLDKMAFPKIKKRNGKNVDDMTKLKINGNVVFENMPKIQYAVNGRTPIQWIIDRYRFSTNKDSGITNDPTKDMTEEKTIELVQRMMHVGVESDRIINELSKLSFEPKSWTPKKSGIDMFLEKENSQSKP